MKVLARLKHPNIVSYQESFEGKLNKIEPCLLVNFLVKKKIIKMSFTGLGWSVLGKTVPSVLGTLILLKTPGTVFPNMDLPASE